MASVQQLGEVSWLVVCAACCHMALVFAVMHLYKRYFLIASVHSIFILFLKSSIDKSTKWPTIPVSPSFMCFFNRGNTEGTSSLKILCLVFVNVLFYILESLWFDDLCA